MNTQIIGRNSSNAGGKITRNGGAMRRYDGIDPRVVIVEGVIGTLAKLHMQRGQLLDTCAAIARQLGIPSEHTEHSALVLASLTEILIDAPKQAGHVRSVGVSAVAWKLPEQHQDDPFGRPQPEPKPAKRTKRSKRKVRS